MAVRDGCGKRPNVAWMDWGTANTLAYHPAILESLGFAQNRAGQLSDAELAKAMGVEKLLIADVKYESATEGQTSSLSNVWGKHIWFGHIPQKAMKYQTSLGYMVGIKGEKPRKVYKYDVNNPPEAKGLIVTDYYDMLLSDASACYLIHSAIA